MRAYTYPEILKGAKPGDNSPTAVAVGASQTDSVVSNEHGISATDALNGRVDMKVSSVTVAAAITAKLQHYNLATEAWADTKTASITADGLVSITWNIEVAGDQTHLPLRSTVRVVVTTGAGDAVTFDSIRISSFG